MTPSEITAALPDPGAARVRPPNRRLVARLLVLVAASFAFGFALVPLYDVFCQATGFNGKTDDGRFRQGGLQRTASEPVARVDASRVVTVEYTSTVMPGLPWEVRPLETTSDVHPGELHTAVFLVSNRSNEPITAHAVPSVSPTQAARHFEKIDCFCFTQQTLLPGEARELPVAFVVKPALDADVRTISLAYAFFKATPSTQAALAANTAISPAAPTSLTSVKGTP